MEKHNTSQRYSTNEIADALDLSLSTVRKYARILEKCNYEFYKTNGNIRIYVGKDVQALAYFKELRENSNVTVEDAAEKVTEMFNNAAEPEPQMIQESRPVHSQEYDELKSLILKQTELIESLTEQIQKQQETIDKQFIEHDRYIMDKMNQSLEAKKLIAAAEEKEKEKEKEKSSFLGKLFGNNPT